MNIFLAHINETVRQARLTKRGSVRISGEYKRFTHKEYVRMESVALPEPIPNNKTLSEAVLGRRSYDMASIGHLTLEHIGTLLGTALGVDKASQRRHYPSGGGLYPVETYLIWQVPDSAQYTAFHYNPTKHTLEILLTLPNTFDSKSIAHSPSELRYCAMVIFTAVWDRSSIKYGDLAYLHAAIEAGHMSQNILLTAEAHKLKSRPYAGFDDEKIIEILDLDTDLEQPIHTVLLSL